MKAVTAFVGLAASLFLAGCGGGGGGGLPSTAGNPVSSFGTVGAGGTINATLDLEQNEGISRPAVGRVAFVTGINPNTGQVTAISAIEAGSNVGATVNNGAATYNSNYAYTVIDNTRVENGLVQGDRISENGSITLNADFDAGTVTGVGPELTVNGTVTGNNLGGTVTANYSDTVLRTGPGGGLVTITDTVNGDLQGSIGAAGLVGAIQGNDANTVISGGIVGQP